MRTWFKIAPTILALALAACGGDDNNGKSTNNGTSGTNNGTTATNNGTSGSNNGTTATNNGTTATNNGTSTNNTNNTTNTNNTNNDLCADVTCDTPPDDVCQGDTAVSYGAGTCDPADGSCGYAETTTDCAAAGQVCAAGVCVAATPEPNPGELVITEFMPNPGAVSDNAGEWFEIYNATSRELDINGLTISDDGGESFAIPAGQPMLAAGAYLVFGNNGDSTQNGGVTVDIEYTGINLANGGDELVITDANAVEIDRVAWDTDNGWIVASGVALQFGMENDVTADDNADPAFWCGAPSTYGDGDYGTPGAANDMCPQPVTATIYEISDENNANHPPANSIVNVVDVVITAIDTTEGYVWLQEAAGGEFSGVYVDAGNVDVSALAVGDVVDVSGAYDEWNGALARITATSITDKGTDVTIMPEVLESSVFADDATAEPWENVLVQINEAGVTDADLNNFGEVLVDSNIAIDDLLFADFATNAADCQVYDFIVGPLNYSFGSWKIEPRDANDIGSMVVATPAVAVAVAGFAFTPQAICVTAGQTVTWTNADAAAHSVTSRLASVNDANSNIPAAPTFDEALPGTTGTATITFDNPGSFPYRCRPHANMEGIVVVPNP